jgi:hypothetical protein
LAIICTTVARSSARPTVPYMTQTIGAHRTLCHTRAASPTGIRIRNPTRKVPWADAATLSRFNANVPPSTIRIPSRMGSSLFDFIAAL